MSEFLAVHHVAPGGTIITHVRHVEELEELLSLAKLGDTLHSVSPVAVEHLAVLDWEIARNLATGQCVQLNSPGGETCHPSN